MSYVAALFDPDRHDASNFDCGEASLNTWLVEHAASSDARRTARTWVWLTENSRVVAYYALAAHRVRSADVPKALGRGGPTEIPAVLIAKLALDQSLQGDGLGATLVGDAMNRIVEATRIVAARLIVVDAIDEGVAGFYERFGFLRVPGQLRLVLRVSAAEAAASVLNPE